MARQAGDRIIEGTIAGITFYRMEGRGYARRKSSLEGERVKRDPKFKRTMEWAQRLARGSQLASQVYRALTRQERAYALYKELKSVAIWALRTGKKEAEVLKLLQKRVKKVNIAAISVVEKEQYRSNPKPECVFITKLFRVWGDRRSMLTDKGRKPQRIGKVLKE